MVNQGGEGSAVQITEILTHKKTKHLFPLPLLFYFLIMKNFKERQSSLWAFYTLYCLLLVQ